MLSCISMYSGDLFKVDGSNEKLVAMHLYVYIRAHCGRLEREASGRHSRVAMSTATGCCDRLTSWSG